MSRSTSSGLDAAAVNGATKAIEDNNVEALASALRGIPHPNTLTNRKGRTLYILSGFYKRVVIMKYLVSLKGCNPNAKDEEGFTGGMAIMRMPDELLLKAFVTWLHQGGDPRIENNAKESTLAVALSTAVFPHLSENAKNVFTALRDCHDLDIVLATLVEGHLPDASVGDVSKVARENVRKFLTSGYSAHVDVDESELAAVVVGMASSAPSELSRRWQSAATEGKVDTVEGKVDAVGVKVDVFGTKVDTLAGEMRAQSTRTEGKVDALLGGMGALLDRVNNFGIAQRKLQDAAGTIRRQLRDTAAQLEDTRAAAVAADAQHQAAMEELHTWHTEATQAAVAAADAQHAADIEELGTKLQDAEKTIADLRNQLHDTTVQLEDARNAATAAEIQHAADIEELGARLEDARAAAVAADAQHAAALEELQAQHTTNLQDTVDAHTAFVAGLEEELAVTRDEAAATATKHKAAMEDLQQQHGAQLHHLTQRLADAQSQLATMTAEAAALASTVKSTSSMVSTRKPWPSGITAEAVAVITAGLSSPNTSPPTTLLLYGLHTHSFDAVMSGINQQAGVACKAVVDMCQSVDEGRVVCREAGLLAWLVASARKTNPGPHWPSMTRVIGSLHGVFRGAVEHDDPCGVVERAGRGYMSCELGHVLGLHALHMLLDMHPEDKYRLVGHLTEDDMMVPRAGAVFYAGGRDEALTQWSMLCGAEFKGLELIVVDPSTDVALSETMREAVSVVGGIADPKAKAVALAVFVQEQLGGSIGGYADIVEACRGEIAEHCSDSRKLKLGELTIGVCRHRAILYKLLADQACISCRLLRGDLLLDDGKTWAPHAWNVVSIEAAGNLADGEGKTHEYFVVDLMRGATLIPSSNGAAAEYRRSGGGTFGGATLLEKPGDLTMEEVVRLPHSAKLGSGSSGAVYKVRDGQAVKIIDVPPEASMEPAMREVKVMSVLRHRYLMPLKQHLMSERTVALVMPLGDHPLSKLSPGTELASLLLQVALGMEHLHGRRRYIVHRDLKPSNIILFQKLDGIVVAKVGDFGSAKVMRHGAPASAGVCTPGYAAPEQRWEWTEYSGVRVSPASDVYAFGQVMGHMYTGAAPSTLPPPQHQYTDAVLEGSGMPQLLKSLYRWCTAADAEDRPTFEDMWMRWCWKCKRGLCGERWTRNTRELFTAGNNE